LLMASNNTGNLPHQRGDRLTYRDRNWSETTGRDNQIPAKRVSSVLGMLSSLEVKVLRPT
jgi:predicted chitinase